MSPRPLLLAVTVRGHSMEPTLHDGQRLLAVRRRHYLPGDLVVFRVADGPGTPEGPAWRVKRVAAVAGDPVPGWLPERLHRGEAGRQVPDGHLVVRGDNAGASQDSRHLGYIPLATVSGACVLALPTTRPIRSAWSGRLRRRR